MTGSRFAILGAEGRVRSAADGRWQVRVGVRVQIDGRSALWETGAGWGEPLDELTAAFLRGDALTVLGGVLHDLGVHGATGEIPGVLPVSWTGMDDGARAWLAQHDLADTVPVDLDAGEREDAASELQAGRAHGP